MPNRRGIAQKAPTATRFVTKKVFKNESEIRGLIFRPRPPRTKITAPGQTKKTGRQNTYCREILSEESCRGDLVGKNLVGKKLVGGNLVGENLVGENLGGENIVGNVWEIWSE